MKKKTLLVLSLMLIFVGCDKKGGTETSSTTSSSNPTSSSTSTFDQETKDAYFDQVFDVYDKLGLNYFSDDCFMEYTSNGYLDTASVYVVNENAAYDLGLGSGVAAVKKEDQTTDLYNYYADVSVVGEEGAEELVVDFIPSYTPVQSINVNGTYYSVPSMQGKVDPIDYKYGMLNKTEWESFLKDYGAKSLRSEFDVVLDEYGEPMLTTDNMYFALQTLYESRLSDYSDVMYTIDDLFSFTASNIPTVTTNISVYEDPEFGNYINIQVYMSNNGEAGSEVPLLERELYPLDGIDQDTLEYYGYVTYVPETFFTEGPGTEPEEVKANRAKFVSMVDKLDEVNNFTIEHIDGSTTYVARAVSDHFVEFGDSGRTFGYGYYNVPLLKNGEPTDTASEATNRDERGLYSFNALTQTENTMLSMALYKANNPGATCDETNMTLTVDTTDDYGQPTQKVIDLNARMDSSYQDTFYGIPKLTSEATQWHWLGEKWSDGLFVSKSGAIFVADYDLKQALAGMDTLVSNYNTSSLALKFTSYDATSESPQIEASVTIYALATNGNYYIFDFGNMVYKNLGTTKATYWIGDPVKKKHPDAFKNLPVEDAPQVTPASQQ